MAFQLKRLYGYVITAGLFSSDMDRRAFLTGCGAALAGATAGCVDGLPVIGGDDGGIDTSSPEAVVESYVDTFILGSFEDPPGEEEFKQLYHSAVVSRLDIDFSNFGGGQANNSDVEIDTSLAEMRGPNVSARDLSEQQLRSEIQDTQESNQQLIEDVAGLIATISDAENALVDVGVTFETTTETAQTDGAQSVETEQESRFIVARDGEAWKIAAVRTLDISTDV